MSTQTIILRCDAAECTKTVEVTQPGALAGWGHKDLRLVGSLVMGFDYCPMHAALAQLAEQAQP